MCIRDRASGAARPAAAAVRGGQLRGGGGVRGVGAGLWEPLEGDLGLGARRRVPRPPELG
eukprot:7194492-Alexandrium_andersonii.AAC.1